MLLPLIQHVKILNFYPDRVFVEMSGTFGPTDEFVFTIVQNIQTRVLLENRMCMIETFSNNSKR